MAGAALADPTPDAGGDRTVTEDVASAYNGTDSSSTATSSGWNFSGAIVDVPDVLYTFNTPGSYPVGFWANDGSVNLTDTITVIVEDVTNPVAAAGSDQTLDEDTAVNFDGSSTTDNDPGFATTGRYYWTFSDGASSVSLSGKTANYTFNTPGSYLVTLLVFDAAGNFASDALTVQVRDIGAPTGSGSVPASADEDTAVGFSSSAASDNDPTFASTRRDYWTFTDVTGQNLSGTSVSYNFATPGTYAITLTVMDATGNMLTQAFSIVIADRTAPTGSGTVPAIANEDSDVAFSSTGVTDNDPTFASTRRDYWTFTNGSAQNLSGTSVSYGFDTPANYTITLTVMDAAGYMFTQTFTLVIRDITLPSGAATVPASSDEDTPVSFSSSAVTDNDPNFASNRRDFWTFTNGTGQNLSGTSVSYGFSTPGVYAITLTTMDAAGNRLTQVFSLTIKDITPPAVTIGASSLGQTRERFTTFTHSGSATDNVGVVAYWWLFTDVTAQNVSGSSLARQWTNEGPPPFTLTLYARDAAWNIASATTTFTVTADVTPPTITFTAPSLTGDDQTPLTYSATVFDLDPSCAASCNWTWSADGVPFSYGIGSAQITWTAGLHVLTLQVRDPSSNTRTSTLSVSIEQIITSPFTWQLPPQALNWNIRVTNGATFTILNSTIYNSSVAGFTPNINISNGRLVIENSQLISNSPTVGFRINATRANPSSFIVVFINSSTISGVYDWIWVVNGTFSSRDSTFTDPRVTVAQNLTGVLAGIDSTIILNNVLINATAVNTTSGIRANFTRFLTAGSLNEILFENVFINATRAPLQITANGTAGDVTVSLRSVTIRSNSTNTTVRGVNITLINSTGNFSNTFQNLDAQNVRYGAIEAVHLLFNGTVSYDISDTNVSGSTSANGTMFHFIESSSTFNIVLSQVSVTRSGFAGIAFRFVNRTLNPSNPALSSPPSRNQGSITIDGLNSWLNTQDGLILSQASSRLIATVTITNSLFAQNTRHGLNIDTSIGNQSAVWWSFVDTRINSNSQRGINYNWQLQRVNISFELLRTSIENNSLEGFFITYNQGTTFDIATRGNFWFNMTNSKINSNQYGVRLADLTSSGTWNFTVQMVDSEVAFNRNDGFYYAIGYRFYYLFRGTYLTPNANFVIDLLRSNISRNSGNGIFFYCQSPTSTYCGYGYPSGTVSRLTNYFEINLNRSHIDFNNGRGVYAHFYYQFYSAVPFTFNIIEESSLNNNGNEGVYEYRFYNYMYGYSSGPQSNTIYYIRNSSLSYNGRLSVGNGFGINTYYYLDYYIYGQRRIDALNATFEGNMNSGIKWSPYQVYCTTGCQASYYVKLVNSTFADNQGYGYEAMYYYVSQCNSVCMYEQIENNTMLRNTLGAIRVGIPQSIGRYFSSMDFRYVNNTIDDSPAAAITTYVTYSYTAAFYAGGVKLNISRNRITNVNGAAVIWTMDAMSPSYSATVQFSDNYIANTTDGNVLAIDGSSSNSHTWTIKNNTFLNTSASALVVSMYNTGSGNTGTLAFQGNTFRDTAGVAFTLIQTNIKMSALQIRDCVFINQQTALLLSGIQGTVDNVTFNGSIKEDISLTNGVLDIHNTPVNVDKLIPLGASSFNVYFDIKLYVSWAGSLKPALGSIVEIADALGSTFFVGSVQSALGLPSIEALSYTKTTQGILGRAPLKVTVSYFEISQEESIDLPSDRTVTLLLRDDIAPAMIISSPEAGHGTRGTTIRVAGTVHDSQSGFDFNSSDPRVSAQFVEISTDGSTWQQAQVESASNFDIQFSLELQGLDESVRAIYVRAHDEAGNINLRVIPVVIDSTPPEIRILESIPAITRASSIHIIAETEVGASVFVNGVVPDEIFTRPDGEHIYFEMDVDVIEGPNTITVVAVDALRNQGRVSIYVLADREAPYLAVLTPDAVALVNTNSVVVSGKATDRNGVHLTVAGLPVTVQTSGNFSVEVPLLSDFNRIDIVATDDAGNSVLVVRDVSFDDLVPWVIIGYPAAGALLNAPEVLVSGVLEQGASITINGESVDAPRGVFARRILLTEGENTIRLQVTDPAGNSVTVDHPVIVDTQAPTITLSSLVDGSLVNRSSVAVEGVAADAHGVALRLNGKPVVLQPDGSFSVPIDLFEGTNLVTLEATDGAGNVMTWELHVLSDTSPPFVAATLEGVEQDGNLYSTQANTIAVSGTAEKGARVEVCYKTADGTDACSVVALASDGSFRTFVDLTKDSTNTIKVIATDPAGNSVEKTYSVDQSQPVYRAPEQPWGAYSLFAVAAGLLLVGAYFIVVTRRQPRREQIVDYPLAGAEAGYAAPPEMAVESAESPTVSDYGGYAPEAQQAPETPAFTPPVEEAVAAPPPAPSRVRPVRRRPALSGSGAGEGTSLSDKGAEDEAVPGESHQEQSKEG